MICAVLFSQLSVSLLRAGADTPKRMQQRAFGRFLHCLGCISAPPFLHNPICYIGQANSTIISSGLGGQNVTRFITIDRETTRTQKHFVKDQESNRRDARSSNNCRTICHCSDFSQAPLLSCLNPSEKSPTKSYPRGSKQKKNNCFCVGVTCATGTC